MAKLTKAQLRQYEEHGYIIFEDSFSAAEIKELRERIDIFDKENETRLRQQGQQGSSIPRFTTHLVQKDNYIKQFTMQQKLVDITTSILGPNIKLYWDQSVYRPPEADCDFAWHQDTGYGPVEPQHYMTFWLALEDANVENGCIWVQPGTHHKGLVEHKVTNNGKRCYFGEDEGIPVPLKAGSMVAFHSLLFHRSTPNLSTSTRKAYIFHYTPSSAYHPETGVVFDNGPVIAQDGKAVIDGYKN